MQEDEYAGYPAGSRALVPQGAYSYSSGMLEVREQVSRAAVADGVPHNARHLSRPTCRRRDIGRPRSSYSKPHLRCPISVTPPNLAAMVERHLEAARSSLNDPRALFGTRADPLRRRLMFVRVQ